MAWPIESQAKALEFSAERRRRRAESCPDCGTQEADWWRGGGRYEIEVYECPGCKLLEAARKPIKERWKHVRLVPKGTADRKRVERERRQAETQEQRAASGGRSRLARTLGR